MLLAPPDKITVWEWADRYRQLPAEGGPTPGQWRTSKTEYLREPMACMTDPSVSSIVLMWASQVGKSEALLNVIAYIADVDPGPTLLIQPTEKSGRAFSTDRVETMIRDTPRLSAIFGDQKKKTSGNSILHKMFPGGHLTIGTAGTPADLAMRPIRYLLSDEVDRYPKSAGDEGAPTALAEKRTRNFWNRKKFYTSSPSVKGDSEIDEKYEQSDKRMFHVPCPHCGEEQTLKWSQVEWDKLLDEDGDVVLNEYEKTKEHFPETALYICEHQGCLWTEADRKKAVSKGRWIASAPFRGTAGFHLNVLYSPFVSLQEIVEEFIEADQSGDIQKMKTFINTALAETFEEKGSTMESSPLYERRETYGPETIPEKALWLTAGIDMQADRLEVLVGAWGVAEENWVVEYLVLSGDPGEDEVWDELDKVLSTRRYINETGQPMRIMAACIDTGGNEGNPERAHRFCKNKFTRKIFPIKGRDGDGPLWPLSATASAVDKGQYKVWMLHVDTAKISLYSRLAKKKVGPGYVHFCHDLQEAFFKGLTVEKKVKKYNRGRAYFIWECPKGKRNEPMDTWNYHYAAFKSLNVRYPTPEELEANLILQRNAHNKTISGISEEVEIPDVDVAKKAEIAQARKVLSRRSRKKRRGQSSKSSLMR